jgi:glycosyltransferase involved in cell wall biosynthesis
MRKEKLSVVMPAFNEETGIARAVSRVKDVLAEISPQWEIIVVDDGSKDATYARICELAKLHNKVVGIRLSRNFGKEAALLAGLRMATGDAAVTIDSDLQHPPELIKRMVAEWRNGATIVHGVKGSRKSDSGMVRLRARIFNKLMKMTAGLDLYQTSDYKLLDRTAIKAIAESLPERLRFYRGLAAWTGFPVAYVHYEVGEREEGRSKWSVLQLFGLAVTAYTSFTALPLRIVTILGILTLAFGIAVGGDALYSWTQGRAVSGFATIVMTLLILGSFTMISLGIIGEYIARIYEEVKERPIYLIEASTLEGTSGEGSAECASSRPNGESP